MRGGAGTESESGPGDRSGNRSTEVGTGERLHGGRARRRRKGPGTGRQVREAPRWLVPRGVRARTMFHEEGRSRQRCPEPVDNLPDNRVRPTVSSWPRSGHRASHLRLWDSARGQAPAFFGSFDPPAISPLDSEELGEPSSCRRRGGHRAGEHSFRTPGSVRPGPVRGQGSERSCPLSTARAPSRGMAGRTGRGSRPAHRVPGVRRPAPVVFGGRTGAHLRRTAGLRPSCGAGAGRRRPGFRRVGRTLRREA